ncbi:MAG: hypothetical protein LUG65_00315, partial [Clostridiales bacterium]|nr:hypothetical protein [Clostridiales bacterium]
QAGWDPRLRQRKPAVSKFENDTLGQLIDRVKKRCLWAIRRDTELAQQDKNYNRTVGGSVRVAYVAIPKP